MTARTDPGPTSAITERARGFWAYYRRYTTTAIHAAATAALTAFGLLLFIDPAFAWLAIAAYVLPPVILYATGRDVGEDPDETERPESGVRSRSPGNGSDRDADGSDADADGADADHDGVDRDSDGDDFDADGPDRDHDGPDRDSDGDGIDRDHDGPDRDHDGIDRDVDGTDFDIDGPDGDADADLDRDG
ncbi:hypothetical protein [Halalkalicoccus tibetensis]|uniref:DUF3099 domain-containing protein n=1 Tax=Halalkalicoccus tibetensis TaxID=175632 RepID=A0ABD5V0J9_9EURY